MGLMPKPEIIRAAWLQTGSGLSLRGGIQVTMLNPAPVTFKTIRPVRSLSRLVGFSLLGFSGAQAGAFLQAQVMNDVLALQVGHWQWNGWLNPKGRVIALFALLRSAEDQFVAVLPDFPAEQLLPMLQRYVFRSKVRIEVLDHWVTAGDFGHAPDLAMPAEGAMPDAGAASNEGSMADPMAPHREIAIPGEGAPSADVLESSPAGSWALDFSGSLMVRRLWLLPAADPALGVEDATFNAAWRRADLAHGLPRLGEDQREAWTPQMLSLDRLNAYSLRKGCYPGQEIVARTHYLGQARRGLARVMGAGLTVGSTIVDADGAPWGQVICTADAGSEALAVVQTDKRGAPAWCAGRKLQLEPFMDGLQRPL